MEGKLITSNAPKATQGKALVEKSGGSVRRRVAANRRMAGCRALCAGQRIDGSVGRDVSGSLCQSRKTANVTTPGQSMARRARERIDLGWPTQPGCHTC